MKKTHLLPLAALLAIAGVGAASAQGTVNMTDQDQLLISQIQTDKRAIVLKTMSSGLPSGPIAARISARSLLRSRRASSATSPAMSGRTSALRLRRNVHLQRYRHDGQR